MGVLGVLGVLGVRRWVSVAIGVALGFLAQQRRERGADDPSRAMLLKVLEHSRHPLASLSYAALESDHNVTSGNTVWYDTPFGRVAVPESEAFAALRTTAFGMSEAAFWGAMARAIDYEPMSSNSKGSQRRGASFFRSNCGSFVLKEQSVEDTRQLLALLPSYFEYATAEKGSLLAKHCAIFVLHVSERDSDGRERNVRARHFLVLQNVFPTTKLPHRTRSSTLPPFPRMVFDLKGSTSGRQSLPLKDWGLYSTVRSRDWFREVVNYSGDLGKKSAQLKDQDWLALGLPRVPVSQNPSVMEQIDRDTRFLAEHGLMDYSLLVGVHMRTRTPTGDSRSDKKRRRRARDAVAPQQQRRKAWRLPWSKKRPDYGYASSLYFENTEMSDFRDSIVGYSIALIDFLQGFNLKKKLETAAKVSVGYKYNEISSVAPETYRQRFLLFLKDAVLDHGAAEYDSQGEEMDLKEESQTKSKAMDKTQARDRMSPGSTRSG